MKPIFSAVIAVAVMAVIFISGYVSASERFSSRLFSIEIPTGMVVDEKKEGALSLVFAGDEELEKGTLSISAKEGKVASLQDQWEKVRPLIISDKTILFEMEVATPVMTWKKVGIKGRTGPIEMQNVTYYGVLNNVIYMLHYHCQSGGCEEIDAAFRTVLNSFKPRGNMQSPTGH